MAQVTLPHAGTARPSRLRSSGSPGCTPSVWLRLGPPLARLNRPEAGEIVERSGRVEPHPRGEQRLRVGPASLTPSAQRETVEATKERPVVNPTPREDTTETGRQRRLGNSDAGFVQLDCRTRTTGVEGDQPEMSLRVDAT